MYAGATKYRAGGFRHYFLDEKGIEVLGRRTGIETTNT